MVTTFVVLSVSAYLCWYANRAFQRTGEARAKVKRAQWAGAFGGAVAGSYVGVAALGSAIPGTIPGALLGYLLVAQLSRSAESGQLGSMERAAMDAAAQDAARVGKRAMVGASGLREQYGNRALALVKTATKWLIVGVVMLLLANANWNVLLGKADGTPAPVAVQVGAPAVVVPSVPPAAIATAPSVGRPPPSASQVEYDQVVRELELAHPELDPTNTRYDQAAVTQILAIAKSVEGQGMPAAAALRLAARDYYDYSTQSGHVH